MFAASVLPLVQVMCGVVVVGDAEDKTILLTVPGVWCLLLMDGGEWSGF